MYREITLKNNVIVLSVPFVHHTELQNFLIAPRTCSLTFISSIKPQFLVVPASFWTLQVRVFLLTYTAKSTSPYKMAAATMWGGPKTKPLPNYQKIVLDRIKACK